MKKITINIHSKKYIKKQSIKKGLVDIRPHLLNNLYIQEHDKSISIGKMPISLIVGSIDSYENILKKLYNESFTNWYWDDLEGLQLINYPTKSIKILDSNDKDFPLNRCFDFLWIKNGSIKYSEIAESIVAIVSMHGKIAIPHTETLSKKYYEQFISTKNLDGSEFKKYERLIIENGLTMDCVFRDEDNSPICLIQNNVNAYNSNIAQIDNNEYIKTELFNVINYNLLYRNNKVLENLGIKPVENWYKICEYINNIINTQVYVQGISLEEIKNWRFNLGYPKILVNMNNNILELDKIDKKYIFTVLNKDNLKVDIK